MSDDGSNATITSVNTVIGGNHSGYSVISSSFTGNAYAPYTTMTQYIDHSKSIGKGIMSIVGCLNTISKDTTSCHIIGNHNSIPTGASKCIIIGDNIKLTEEHQLNEAVYIGGTSKVLVQMNGEFVDIIERLAVVEEKFADLEEKVNILLYAPGGPMYQVAKQSFDSLV